MTNMKMLTMVVAAALLCACSAFAQTGGRGKVRVAIGFQVPAYTIVTTVPATVQYVAQPSEVTVTRYEVQSAPVQYVQAVPAPTTTYVVGPPAVTYAYAPSPVVIAPAPCFAPAFGLGFVIGASGHHHRGPFWHHSVRHSGRRHGHR